MSDFKRYQREDASNLSQSYDFLKGTIGPTRSRIKKRAPEILGPYLKQGGARQESDVPMSMGGGMELEGGPNSQMITEKLATGGLNGGAAAAGFISDAKREYMRLGGPEMNGDWDEWLGQYAVKMGVL